MIKNIIQNLIQKKTVFALWPTATNSRDLWSVRVKMCNFGNSMQTVCLMKLTRWKLNHWIFKIYLVFPDFSKSVKKQENTCPTCTNLGQAWWRMHSSCLCNCRHCLCQILSTVHSYTDGPNPDSWELPHNINTSSALYACKYKMSVCHYQCSKYHTASVTKSEGVINQDFLVVSSW